MIFSLLDIDEAFIGGPFAGFIGQLRRVDLRMVAGTPLWVGIKPPHKH